MIRSPFHPKNGGLHARSLAPYVNQISSEGGKKRVVYVYEPYKRVSARVQP